MSRSMIVISIGLAGAIAIGLYLFFTPTSITCKDLPPMNLNVKTVDDVRALFPTTTQEIDARARCSMDVAKKSIDAIIALSTETRTFENTALALDRVAALSDFSVSSNAIELMEYVHPDEQIRNAAHSASIAMKEFYVENINNNRALYQALKSYVEGTAASETLRPDQQYFLKEMIADYKRSGLDLPDDKLAVATQLNKDIAKLCSDFEVNIASDNKTITVSREDLAGVDEDFINSLKKTNAGDYILGVDYPTIAAVMENCTVGSTRQSLFAAFNNRGYPANDAVLKELISKRDSLAQLLSFKSYANLDIDALMAKTPERVEQFLDGIIGKAGVKTDKEYALLKAELPASVALTQEGKLNPWDLAYLKNQYKKKHLQVDEQAIAEYFPMEHTIKGLLAIYEQFLGIRFEQIQAKGFWHEDVQLIAVYRKSDNALLSYLLLDLYPRPNKYSHACHATIIPAVKDDSGNEYAEVSLVIANFPKSTANKPSLLRRGDVNTFFHEFGHGMHAVLGRTYLATQAGTAVKSDFVEMPSQMLEEWLWDKDILKMLSKHYKSGEQMPDDLIEKILKTKNYDSGDWAQRQCYLASMSLDLFLVGANKDPYAIQRDLYIAMRPQVKFYTDDHMYASFGHLTNYSAHYYGYLWAKVFALDMFNYIKQQNGLLSPEVGQHYINTVIGKGGSEDPNELLRNFLGREPNDKAFFEDLGL